MKVEGFHFVNPVGPKEVNISGAFYTLILAWEASKKRLLKTIETEEGRPEKKVPVRQARDFLVDTLAVEADFNGADFDNLLARY